MACIACENYAKRVTNVFRDEELKARFYNLTSFEILSDCFICDACNEKLKKASTFKNKCVEIYKRNHPDVKNQSDSSTVIENKQYFILQTNEEVLMNQDGGDESNTQNPFIQMDQSTIDEEDVEYSILETNIREYLPVKEKKPPARKKKAIEYEEESGSSSSSSSSHKKKTTKFRKTYSVQKKLEIIKFAENFTNREAARKFGLNESSVRCFRRQKETLLGMQPEKSTNRRGIPYWPELEVQLKAWTEEQMRENNKPKINEIKDEAIKIAKSMGYDNFNGSTSYIFKFMQRNNIDSSSPRPRKIKVEGE